MANDVKIKVGFEVDQAQLAKTVKEMQDTQSKMKFSPVAKDAADKGSFITIDRERRAAQDSLKLDIQKKQVSEGIFKLAQAIGLQNEKNARQEHIANIQKANFTQTQRAAGWGARGNFLPSPAIPSPSGGGWNIPRGGVTDIKSLLPPEAKAAIATLMTVTAAAEGTRRFFSEASNRARVAESSAFNMQGQGGQRLQSFINGGSLEEFQFNSQ